MSKHYVNLGFSVVEALLILVAIGILGFTGWYVYHAKQTSNKDYSDAASNTVPTYKKNPYAGWKTYSSSNGLGLGFKYPASWTVTEDSAAQAQYGSVTTTLTPPTSEIEAAFNQVGAAYTPPSQLKGDNLPLGSYFNIGITKAGQPVATPGPDQSGTGGVYNWDGQKFNYLLSTDEISSGVLKNDWFTFYGSVEDTSSTADAMVITNNQYGNNDAKFTESTILTLKGAQYQIVPAMGERFAQYQVQTTIDTAKFKTTDLYKDVLLALNSMQ